MKYFIIMLIAVFALSVNSQDLHWTNIAAIQDSIDKEVKPILVKIETKSCGYCKLMDQKVFPNKRVRKELNKKYYYVKFDAESRESISINDTNYNFVMYSRGRGVHQLAKKWGEQGGMLKYPTIVILNEKWQVIRLLDGYLPKRDFYQWLRYEE